jgi:hypothetical protein
MLVEKFYQIILKKKWNFLTVYSTSSRSRTCRIQPHTKQRIFDMCKGYYKGYNT